MSAAMQQNGKTGNKKTGRRKTATFALVFTCLAVIAAILVWQLTRPATRASAGKLVISEVMASNRYALTSETLGTPDWIELYNASSEDIRLSGYALTNNVKDLRKFVFPDVVLGAGEYLVVYACDKPADAGSEALATGFNISRSGEILFLSDAYAGLVQQLEVPELYSDVSYARSASGTYGYTCASTPGAANDDAAICASISELLNASSGDLVLSEVDPYPSDGAAWAELYNPSDEAISLSDYFISDQPDDPQRVRLPDYILKPKGYALVYFVSGGAAEDDRLTVAFGIGRQDTALQISSADGQLQSALTWSASLPSDLSAVHGEDEENIAIPTPLAANPVTVWTYQEPSAMDATDPLVISEVMPDNNGLFPDQSGDTPEWVELYNRSDAPVSLNGYFLSDDPSAPARCALPDQTLAAGGYVVVWLSEGASADGELHANFRLGVGETLTLTDLSTMRQDACEFDGSCPENASFSVSDDGAYEYYGTPTPGYKNAKSYSLSGQIGWFDADGVCVSEVFASGDDAQGDWVEFYNGSSEAVSLDGWFLTDSWREPQKYSLSGITVPAGGYAVADGASVCLSAEGETLFLLKPSGCPEDIFQTGALAGGISSGRNTADATVDRVFFSETTRGAENTAAAYDGFAAVPAFSTTDLYHEEPFTLTVRAAADGAVVRYTTDGSYPTENSPEFPASLTISSNCVVRAASFQAGLLPSNCVTATYLFTQAHTVPVVCITADPDELKPVLKTQQRENKPECRGDIAYYDETGAFCVRFVSGVRAKGRSMLMYSQKSFSLKLRGRYGQSSVSYPFFSDSDIDVYSAFTLRNGGQDRSRSRLRDSYFSRLAEDLNIDNFKTRIVALYVNGKFYGIYDLNEEQDESYLAAHYGVDPDAVDIINRNDEVKEGSADEFLRIREFAKTEDLSNDAVYAQFCEWVDVDYFIDYLVFRSYIADTDMINQAYWRSQDYTVKWRPILFDLDYGLYGNEYQQSYEKDVLGKYFSETGVPSADKSKTYFEIYIGLKKNAGWRKKFVARYVELMHTTLSPENMLALLDEMDDDYLTEMPRQVEMIHFPASVENTSRGLEQLRDAIQKRPAYALEYLKQNFPGEADYIDELESAYR